MGARTQSIVTTPAARRLLRTLNPTATGEFLNPVLVSEDGTFEGRIATAFFLSLIEPALDDGVLLKSGDAASGQPFTLFFGSLFQANPTAGKPFYWNGSDNLVDFAPLEMGTFIVEGTPFQGSVDGQDVVNGSIKET